MPLYIPYSLTGKWHLGRGVCKLWLLMDYLLCTASVFSIVLISYDRFLSVTKAVSTLLVASLTLSQDHWRIILTNRAKPRFSRDNSPQKSAGMWRLLDICSYYDCGESSALSILRPRGSQTGLFSQFLLRVAVVLLLERKKDEWRKG